MKIEDDKLSQSQATNLKASITAYNEKKLVSGPSPPVLYIELTQNCVARCDYCREEQFMNNPSYNMSDEIFDILLKDYIPYATLVDLRGWGESLILPDFDRYVKNVAELGPQIRLTTTLGCGNSRALQSLIDYDVFVSVSIDAAEKDVYEHIRKGIKFDTMLKNLEFLTHGITQKHGSLDGRIRFGIVPLQAQYLDQVEKIIQLAIHYGIPIIRLGPLGANPKNPALLQYHRGKTIDILQKCVEYSRKSGIRFQLARSPFEELHFKDKAFDLCYHPWGYAFVDYSGNLSYCDHITHMCEEKAVLGRIQENSVEELWNGMKAQALRNYHLDPERKDLPNVCAICYRKGRYADHEHEIDPQFSKWLLTEEDIKEKLSSMRYWDGVKLHLKSFVHGMLRRFYYRFL